MNFPQAPTHVFTPHGKDGNRWATCSCNWESPHLFSKQQVEVKCAEHANLNAAPACLTCLGSGRSALADDICPVCLGTGRQVA